MTELDRVRAVWPGDLPPIETAVVGNNWEVGYDFLRISLTLESGTEIFIKEEFPVGGKIESLIPEIASDLRSRIKGETPECEWLRFN